MGRVTPPRWVRRGAYVLALALLGLVLVAAWLWLRPPALLRVGANYAAKMVCSNVFIARRDAAQVLRDDVQAPGHPLLRLMRVQVDREQGVVRAGLWGWIGDGLAVARPEGGCSSVPDGDITRVMRADAELAQAQIEAASAAALAHVDASLPWPRGEAAAPDQRLDRVIADTKLTGAGMRAVLVVQRGRIVAERYGDGFDARTPQLGWSMTKSVLAGVVGVLINEGQLSLETAGFWPATHDGRERIRIADLLAMSSGLKFNEEYGAVSDVTRMLYLQSDMAGFAAAQPLEHPVGTVWSYSSGSALVLSRIAQDTAGGAPQVWLRQHLFGPLGMRSAVIEVDERGTLVGSSYMYATARDWARYAQFLLQGGVWEGRALLPAGFVNMMASPAAASHGEYGQGLVWLDAKVRAEFALPADTFWMEGHDGQSIAVIPSRQVVVVRMGLTPSRLQYRPQPLVQAVLDVLTRETAGATE